MRRRAGAGQDRQNAHTGTSPHPAYAYRTRSVHHSALNPDRPYAWSGSTVAGILEHEEYIGNTINCRTYTPSFKSKKSHLNPPDKILRFEGTHEPLIALDTWDAAGQAETH